MKNYAIVLAAGNGTRMKVDVAKCLHHIIKKPMIEYVVESIDNNTFNKTMVVISSNHEDKFKEVFPTDIEFVIQPTQKGTGDAVSCCLPNIKDLKGYTLILPGDVPLIKKEELNEFFKYHLESKNDVSVLTTNVLDPINYGRIIRKDNQIVDIVEQENLTDNQKEIKEVNTGIYLVSNCVLVNLIESNNLPDIVKLAVKTNRKVGTFVSNNPSYYIDVNDFYTVAIVESKIKLETNKKHLLNGVNIISPETVTIASNVVIEPGVTIYPNTFITGDSRVYKGATIGPDSEVHNSIVDENAIIRHSLITDSYVGKNTTVGPFAHLRNNTHIGDDCRIGNYVEIKNSRIGNLTKISHLTYVGDTTCGSNVNWGCGTVTVNYDGKNKNKTIVGDNVFIGCNTNLIAPLKVGNNAFIAAGSTITEDVPDEAFSIARERQVTKEDYASKYEYKKK